MNARSELPPASCWDLTPLYPSFQSWKMEMEKELREEYSTRFAPLSKNELSVASTLKALLDSFYMKERHLKKLYTWAHLYHDQETALTAGREAVSLSMHAYSRFREATSWIEPAILQLNTNFLNNLVQSEELSCYKILLERLVRMKPHVLREREEKLLAFSEKEAATPDKIFHALNDTDFVFPHAVDETGSLHTVTHGSYAHLQRSNDRTLRENAFHSLLGTFHAYKTTFAEILSGQMNRHLFEMKSRKYSSCLEAALFSKKIPTSLYKTLLSTVRSHLPVLHRYMKVRKEALQVDMLKPWDLYVSLIPSHREPHYTFDEAKHMVLTACQKLGKTYTNTLKKGLEKHRWVDVYETKSKRSGAYSSGCYDSHPYILMNYKGLLRDVHTLAHEAGHSMHSFFSRRSQPYHFSEYEIFVAEVASTLNEELLTEHLLSHAKNEKERLFLILEQIEDIRATFFRQTLFAEFELFLHEEVEKGTPLTSDLLANAYKKLYQEYYGPSLECTDELSVEWARIPHFYANFYVYQYATGISAAHALYEQLKSGASSSQKRYLSFLQSGSVQFPIELLQEAGVDMLSPAPYVQMVQHFDALVDELEQGLRKLALKTRNC